MGAGVRRRWLLWLFAGKLVGAAGCRAPPPPDPVMIEVRDIRGGAPGAVYVWDAGDAAGFLIPLGAPVPRVQWHASEPPAELPMSVERDPEESVARLRIRLPSTPGPGQLGFAFPGRSVLFRAELWRPRPEIEKELLLVADLDLEQAATATSPAIATTAWLERFRRHLRAGQDDAALGAVQRWKQEAERRELDYSALRAVCVASFLHGGAGRGTEAAEAAIDCRARAAHLRVALAKAAADLFLGQALITAGEGGAAERVLSRSADMAARAGTTDIEAQARSLTALVQVQLGRLHDALRTLETHPLPVGTSTAARANRFANEADVLLRLWQRHGKADDFERALELLRASRDLYAALPLPPKARARSAEIAHALALAGKPAEARAALGELGEADVDGVARGLPTLTRARLDLLEDRADAAEALLLELVEDPPGEWDELGGAIDIDAQSLLAEAYRRQGKLGAAADALGVALRAAHERVRRTDLAAEPAAALGRFERLRQKTVSALVGSGRPAHGFALDDRHRSAVVGRLEPRAAGPVSEVAARYRDALEAKLGRACLPPSAGPECPAKSKEALRELEEALSPLELGALGAVASSSRIVEVDPLRLVGQVASALGPGERLWVVTSTTGPRRGFDVGGEDKKLRHGPLEPSDLLGVGHLYLVSDDLGDFERLIPELIALPDGPSASLLPYASWLAQPRAAASGPAVLVADTVGDLPGAREEARAARVLLPGARARIGEGIERSELLALLRDASVFHFAGHGELLGRDPWASFLRIGPGAVLTVDDWVRAAPAPRLVILDGCTTSGRTALAGQVGFPQAMLQTGSDAVLATTRPVRDAGARAFVVAFLEARGATRPGRAFVEAVRAESDDTWSSFVLWGRPY